MRLFAATAIAALALGVGAAQAAVNLVQNGGFENVTLTPAQLAQLAGPDPLTGTPYVGFQVTYPGGAYANAVNSWTSAQTASSPQAYNLWFADGTTAQTRNAFSQYTGEAQHPNSNFTGASPDGGAFMVLDGDPNFTGPLSQTINGLVVNQTYTLGFYYADGELSNRNGFNTEQLFGSFGGDAFSTPVYTNSVVGDHPGSFSGWQHLSFTFTAHSTSQVLSFMALGTPTANLPPVSFLDGVTLTGAPEPATWAMVIMGFGALGAMARRRRAQSAAA